MVDRKDERQELERERDLLGSALEASEQLTRGILAAVPAAIVHVGADGAIKNANAEALRLLGLSFDTLTKRYTRDFDAVTVWEDGTPCSVEDYPVTVALATGEPQPPCTIGVKRPDGSLSWCIFRAVPVKDAEGGLAGAVVTFLDITDRIATEDALRRSEARIKAIVESTPGVILTCDLDGRLTFINRVIPELDLEASSVVGRSFFEWINPRDHARMESILARVRQGETVSYELEGLDGADPNWYGSRVGPIVRDGQVVGYATVATLITDRKRAEAERAQLIEQLNQAQRLEALGRLAGGIAHDFNNLLTVIQGNVDLLASRSADPTLIAGIEEIAAATERAATLTGQLLAFGRSQSLEPRQIDLGEVVDGISSMLRRLVGEHIALSFERAAEPGVVLADPVAIERVIVNLAVNSSEAMPEGGTLTIATKNVTVAEGTAALPAGTYVCLSVTDTGKGIDQETQRRLFEPFFTKKGTGTGLGLATVHGVVAQSGGHIAVESEPGSGATFQIFLPRAAAAKAEEAPVPPKPEPRGAGRILLVEDDLAVQRVACMILESAGFEVVVAENTQAALDLDDAALNAIDLLLSDVVMPGHSGPTIAARLKARSPQLEVLLVSGHVRHTMGPLPAGVPFLHKPFTAPALIEKVGAILDARDARVARLSDLDD